MLAIKQRTVRAGGGRCSCAAGTARGALAASLPHTRMLAAALCLCVPSPACSASRRPGPGAQSHVAELPWAGPSAGPLCSPRAPSPADGQRRARGCFTVSSHSRCLHVCPRRWGACKGGCRQPGACRHFAELSPLCRAAMAPGVSPQCEPGFFSSRRFFCAV